MIWVTIATGRRAREARAIRRRCFSAGLVPSSGPDPAVIRFSPPFIREWVYGTPSRWADRLWLGRSKAGIDFRVAFTADNAEPLDEKVAGQSRGARKGRIRACNLRPRNPAKCVTQITLEGRFALPHAGLLLRLPGPQCGPARFCSLPVTRPTASFETVSVAVSVTARSTCVHWRPSPAGTRSDQPRSLIHGRLRTPPDQDPTTCNA